MWCSLAQAQSIQILDSKTHAPLDLVNVYSEDPLIIVYSDERGKVNLKELSTTSQITISQVGYHTLRLTYDQLTSLSEGKLYMSTSLSDLDEFVISATRWKQQKRDVPVKIATISAEEIDFRNPQTAADLLSFSDEVYVQKSQLGGGSPMIRGFSTNRVLISVDGVRMNNAIFRSGNVQNVISIDPFSIASTEVLFGPGSVMYGSDAIGGVMNFNTLPSVYVDHDSSDVKANFSLRTSSANFERTGHFDLTFSKRRWGFISGLSISYYDDLMMGANGPKDYLRKSYVTRINGVDTLMVNRAARNQVSTGFQKAHFIQKVFFKPTKMSELSYTALINSTSSYNRYDRLLEPAVSGGLRSAEWYYGPQVWNFHSLKYEVNDSTALFNNLRAQFAYQAFEESRHNRDFGDTLRYHKAEVLDALSASLDLNKILNAKHRLFYGVEGVINLVSSEAEIENLASQSRSQFQSRYPDGSTWFSGGIYAGEEARLSEKVTLLTEARYTVVNIQADLDTTFLPLPVTSINQTLSAFNGSFGAAIKPTERWQINVNLSTGFRAPNIDDLGKVFDSEPGSVVIPNPTLKPEYAYNAELGITKEFGSFLQVNASGYYTWLTDALVRRNYQLNGSDSIMYQGTLSQVQAIQNAASAYVYGFEAGFELKLPQDLGLAANVNYQRGEEELDDGSKAPLRHAAPTYGVIKLYRQTDKLRLETNVRFNDELTSDRLAPSELAKSYLYAHNSSGNPYSPAWYTWNFSLQWNVYKGLFVSGGIENITNVRYRPYSSGITAPGRNFIAALKVSF